MAALNQDQIKILEQTRQRLLQLTQSLASLINNLNQSDPLPAWTSLQSQATIISNNLLTVSQQLTDHRDLLASLVAYPTPQFPGRTQSALLGQLMRTKLDPRVEDWVSRGRSVGTSAVEPGTGLSADQLTALWHWAPIEANQEARKRNWGGHYTLEEMEMGVKNVVTGLRRKLNEDSAEGSEEDDGEEEDDDGEEKESGQISSQVAPPALPLDDVFRFMMMGTEPKSS